MSPWVEKQWKTRMQPIFWCKPSGMEIQYVQYVFTVHCTYQSYVHASHELKIKNKNLWLLPCHICHHFLLSEIFFRALFRPEIFCFCFGNRRTRVFSAWKTPFLSGSLAANVLGVNPLCCSKWAREEVHQGNNHQSNSCTIDRFIKALMHRH